MLVVSAGGFLIGSVGCEPVGCCVVSEGGRLGVGRGWGGVVTVLVVALLAEPDLLVDAPLTALVVPADAEVLAPVVGDASIIVPVTPVEAAMLALVYTVGDASIIALGVPIVLAPVECVCI